MQLKRLYIKDYKILRDFSIKFPNDSERYICIFIGVNGSGKSTILESIARIFSDVLLNNKASFGFELEYSVRHEQYRYGTSTTSTFHSSYSSIKLSATDKGDPIQIRIVDRNGKTVSKNNFLEKGKRGYSYLPDNIVIYYSGLSEIMLKLVEPHNEKISTSYRKNNTHIERDFFYFQPEHFGIILTSLLSFEYGDIPDFLKNKAKIDGVQSIKIRLKKPLWASDSIENFWGIQGEIRNFLDYLKENVGKVDDMTNSESSRGIGNILIETSQDDMISISIISQEKLFEIRNHLIEEKRLFEILNILLTDGLLKDISFVLKKEGENNFSELSEGEQQAISIRGLTELLSEKNSLFLLDEPDAYLHPKWQHQLVTDIENTINSNSNNSFIIATHSPQLLSNATSKYNFVKIIEDGELIENTPRYYGRAIDSILYELMGVEERNKIVRDKISSLFTHIEEEEIKNAEQSLKGLQNLIGEDDPELKSAEIQISYLKEEE